MVAAICDDDRIWARQEKRVLTRYAEEKAFSLNVFYFPVQEMLFRYEGAPIDIIFLDVEFQGTKGITVAREINRRWKNCQIVYVTNNLYYAMDVYSTNHTCFVLKSQFEDKIADVFKMVEKRVKQKKNQVTLSEINGKKITLPTDDFLFLERSQRITFVQTVWGTYRVREKLDELKEIFNSPEFVRCHNSFIVYLPAVLELQKAFFLLRDGTIIMISRSYGKTVRDAFARWATDKKIQGVNLLNE